MSEMFQQYCPLKFHSYSTVLAQISSSGPPLFDSFFQSTFEANFYVDRDDVDKPLAACVVRNLSEMNTDPTGAEIIDRTTSALITLVWYQAPPSKLLPSNSREKSFGINPNCTASPSLASPSITPALP
jgi:hypothetical protein